MAQIRTIEDIRAGLAAATPAQFDADIVYLSELATRAEMARDKASATALRSAIAEFQAARGPVAVAAPTPVAVDAVEKFIKSWDEAPVAPEEVEIPPASVKAVDLAAKHGVDLALVPHKGAKITAIDVESYIEAKEATL